MINETLIEALKKLPPQTEIYVRGGAPWPDDAWEISIRVFSSNGRLSAYLCPQGGHHVNFPENYSGVKEVTKEYFP